MTRLRPHLRSPRPHTRAFEWQEARDLRASGLLYREIGERLGVSAQAARMACNPDKHQRRLIKDYVEKPREELSFVERIGNCFEFAEDGCWNWTDRKVRYGYGFFAFNRRRFAAHRAMYELLVGPIPEGLTLDHLCRNTSCVNPEHLEPVTRSENARRAATSRRFELDQKTAGAN